MIAATIEYFGLVYVSRLYPGNERIHDAQNDPHTIDQRNSLSPRAAHASRRTLDAGGGGDAMTTRTSYPAQIVFTESDRGGRWRGRLLNRRGCVDTQTRSRPVTWTPYYNIKEGDDGRFYVTMQGGATFHSRRYRRFDSLDAAQKNGIRWAGRRFRIPVEQDG